MKVVCVLPAYNAEKTLARTVSEIPASVVDDVILVDDASTDRTVEIARKLGLNVFCHDRNGGYGANQKTCYREALAQNADVVVMVHPDHQYDPTVVPELVEPILQGEADAVFGSRMMKQGALAGGMPVWKYVGNILLTFFENTVLRSKLTEYHSGLRAYSADLLKTVRFELNSDGFVFDTEIIVQALQHRFRIKEIPIRTSYAEDASQIGFFASVRYALGIGRTMLVYLIHSSHIHRFRQFS